MNRRLLRELITLITIAVIFGFVYTLIMKKGFFTKPNHNPVESTSNLEVISLSKAKELFESDNAFFIDTRHEYDYSMGHIQNAINIPLFDLENYKTRLREMSREKTLVLYCDGEECNSSIETANKLIGSGFKNVNVFFGGWQEWKNAGLPIEKKNEKYIKQ